MTQRDFLQEAPSSTEMKMAGTGTLPRFTPSRLLARNATLNLVTQAWIFIVLIVAMPKLVHYLGETSFGLFSLAWVIIGYLSFLDIGVNRAATKFISEHLAEQDHDSARQIVRTALAANLCMGLIGGLAVVIASPYLIHLFKVSAGLQAEARWTFYAVAFAVPVLLVQGVFRAVLSSFQRFGWMNSVDALTMTAQWGLAAFLAWRGHGIALVVFSTVMARILATAGYGWIALSLFPDLQLFRMQGFHGASRLLRFGGWVSLSQVISPLLIYVDRVFIASWVSLGAVTLYTVPFEAIARLRIIPTSLMGTVYPAFSERGGDRDKQHLDRLYERSVRYLLLLLVPGILYLLVLGHDLFRIWMGATFAQQVSTVLSILVLGILTNSLAQVPASLLQALGRPDLTGKFHLLELPVHIALCGLLIPRWGIAGAALATTIRFSLDCVLLFWTAGKYCRCSLRGFWLSVLPRIALLASTLALALFATVLAFENPWIRLSLGALWTGGCLISLWAFAVEREEKPRISGMLRTFLGQQTA
jgi:O-antigen/teichoic acid export membrane protein